MDVKMNRQEPNKHWIIIFRHYTKKQKQKKDNSEYSYSPAELVEHSDVCIHVVNVVGVGGVLDDVPLLWFGALGGEHVATVLGLIVHTVEPCHLHTARKRVNHTLPYFQQKFIFMFDNSAENI